MIVWPVEYVESKYSRWYEALIQKAQLRGTVEGYKETHHIIPRSFGGSNDKNNLVQLTAREHYIAHALLWKMKFPGVYGSKMAFAFNTFISQMGSRHRGSEYKINSRIYQVFKIYYAKLMSETMSGEGNHFYGKTHSAETRKIIGEKSKLKEFKRGPDNPRYGKPSPVSEAGKAKQIQAIKERWSNPEFRSMMIEKRKAFYQTPEGIAQRKASADRLLGVKKNPESVEKTARAKRGKKWEELYSPETIKRLREGLKNRVISEDGIERIRASSREVGKRPKSMEHRKRISESNKKHDRWWTRGENNPMYGKKHSLESRQKMSEKLTGKKCSPEELEKRKQTRLANSKVCEHCNKLIDATNFKRWHGPKCKTLKKDENE
jgi:hypothetical protein